MPAMKKLKKLSIAVKISRAWPAPTVLFYLTSLPTVKHRNNTVLE